MDSKKKTFHHKKDDDDSSFAKASEDKDEEKKPRAHPKVEEVEEETAKPGGTDNAEPAEATQEAEPETDQPQAAAGGPKINFDYPLSKAQSGTFSQIQKTVGGANLDDLAQEPEEEYDQATYAEASVDKPNQPTPATGDPAPKQVNPYANKPQQDNGEFGMRGIKQSQPGPTFPGGQNMNGNGDGNLKPPGQFGTANPNSNFNFRREGNYRSNSGSNKAYLIVLLVIGLVVLGGAVYLLKNQLTPTTPKPTPTPVAAITTPEPAPTPEAIDRSQFTVRILNGSGKTGLAAEVSDKLKELGYKVERTGNATNSAFANTLVRVKGDQTLSEQLIEDLSYQFEASVSSILNANDPSDAEIILGAK